MSDEQKFITKEKAIEIIGKKEEVHTFLNPGAGMLLGADWSWGEVLKALDAATEIQIGGEESQRMKHPIVIDYKNRYVFIEATNFQPEDA